MTKRINAKSTILVVLIIFVVYSFFWISQFKIVFSPEPSYDAFKSSMESWEGLQSSMFINSGDVHGVSYGISSFTYVLNENPESVRKRLQNLSQGPEWGSNGPDGEWIAYHVPDKWEFNLLRPPKRELGAKLNWTLYRGKLNADYSSKKGTEDEWTTIEIEIWEPVDFGQYSRK